MPTTLSEADSKRQLATHGIPFLDERVVDTPEEAASAAEELVFPVVVKLGGPGIAHKTERNLVRLGLGRVSAVREAARSLLALAQPGDGQVHLLVAPMVRGQRELIVGLQRNRQFGATIMLGVGGILAEAATDVTFRLVPLTRVDAFEMMDDLRSQRLLGPLRGEPGVDRAALADVLLALSRAADADPRIVSVDLNPVIIVEGRPVPVDALVEWEEDGSRAHS